LYGILRRQHKPSCSLLHHHHLLLLHLHLLPPPSLLLQTFDLRNKDGVVDFPEFLDFVMKRPVTLVDLETSSLENYMRFVYQVVVEVRRGREK